MSTEERKEVQRSSRLVLHDKGDTDRSCRQVKKAKSCKRFMDDGRNEDLAAEDFTKETVKLESAHQYL